MVLSLRILDAERNRTWVQKHLSKAQLFYITLVCVLGIYVRIDRKEIRKVVLILFVIVLFIMAIQRFHFILAQSLVIHMRALKKVPDITASDCSMTQW